MTLRTDMNDLFKCDVLAPTPDNLEKLEIDDARATEIEARFRTLQSQLDAMQVGAGTGKKLDQKFIAQTNQQNLIRVGESIRSMALDTARAKGFQAFMVRDMAIVHSWLGMGDEFTSAGWVRESMNRIRRLWRGGINDMMRRYGVMEYAKKNYPEVASILKKRGLRQDQIDRVTTELAEKSFYPILRETQDLAPRGRHLLDMKYQQFVDSLYHTYHLQQDEVNRVLEIGQGMSETYHRVALAAQNAGIDVKETPFWGYFPRILSTDAQRRYTWKWEDENHILWNNGDSTPATEALLKSRSTNQYIVEDEVLFDFVLRSLGQSKYGDPAHYYKLVSKEEGAGIADVLDSNYGLAQTVAAILDGGHPDVVSALLDSGLLSKVPYSTVETFEYMKQTLDFPFNNLREAFAVDWGTGMQVYREQLSKVAEESGFVNLIVKESIEGNWAVNTSQRLQNPKEFAGFVPLREVIAPNILKKSFQSYNPMLGDLYVHPLVAQLAKAQQDLLMSPQALGVFARMVNSVTTRWKQLALATFEYVPRQIWQNLIGLAAAGGNILNMPKNMNRFMLYELLHNSNPEMAARMFDNTRKVYQLADGKILTELELVRYLEDTGTLSRFEPLTGGELNPGQYSPNGIKRQARYLAHTFRKEGIPRTLEEATEFLGGMVDKVTYPMAWSNNWLNNSAAFTLIESVTKLRGQTGTLRSLLHSAGTLPSLSLKSFDTVDEAIQHARQFFYYYDDMTYTDRTLNRFVMPFWSFTSKNVPNVIRYAVRNPSRFYAWQRAYAMANQPMQDDEWLNEGSVDEWLLHSNPLWFKVPGGRPDGRDEYFSVPMESIDPLNSALNWVQEPTQALMEMFGIWDEHTVKTTRERLDSQPWNDTATNQALNSLLENTYPLWQAAASELRGEDMLGSPLDEGETLDTFLGIRMSPRLRLWLTTLAPVLRTLDTLNPNGVFGTPARYDINSEQWSLGEPSWAGVRRTSRDNFGTANRYEALRWAGVKVYPVDVYLNAGLTYDSLSVSVSEGRKFIAKAKEDAALITSPDERAKRLNEIAEMEYVLAQTREDLIRFGDFMQREGLNPRAAYQRLRQRNVRIGDLPLETEENEGQQPAE